MPTNPAPLKALHLIQRDAFMDGVRWYTGLIPGGRGSGDPWGMYAAASNYYPDPITVPRELAKNILDDYYSRDCRADPHTAIQASLTKFLPQLLALKDTAR